MKGDTAHTSLVLLVPCPDNGIGIAGVAWECPLMAVRAGLSLGGSSRMQDDDSAAAIVYAADNGASVINMSWGQ